MIWVTKAKHLHDFEIEVHFNNGKTYQIDLSEHLTGKVFKPLLNVKEFAKLSVHPELDTVVWKNGADFSPEFLYELGKEQAKKIALSFIRR